MGQDSGFLGAPSQISTLEGPSGKAFTWTTGSTSGPCQVKRGKNQGSTGDAGGFADGNSCKIWGYSFNKWRFNLHVVALEFAKRFIADEASSTWPLKVETVSFTWQYNSIGIHFVRPFHRVVLVSLPSTLDIRKCKKFNVKGGYMFVRTGEEFAPSWCPFRTGALTQLHWT